MMFLWKSRHFSGAFRGAQTHQQPVPFCPVCGWPAAGEAWGETGLMHGSWGYGEKKWCFLYLGASWGCPCWFLQEMCFQVPHFSLGDICLVEHPCDFVPWPSWKTNRCCSCVSLVVCSQLEAEAVFWRGQKCSALEEVFLFWLRSLGQPMLCWRLVFL